MMGAGHPFIGEKAINFFWLPKKVYSEASL